MRGIARMFSIALLTAVGALTGVVLLCGALLPRPLPMREGESARLLRLGYRWTAIRFDEPRFEEGALRFDRVESYELGSERHDLVAEVRLPAARGGEADRSACEPFVARLLAFCDLLPDRSRVAISPHAPELAFASPAGILRRRTDGAWENASGGELPSALQTLNDAKRGAPPVPDRLAHPDAVVWADAVVESLLRQGVRARVFGDALERCGSEAGPLRDLWIRFLLDAGDLDEVARLAVEGTGFLPLRLLDELGRIEGKSGALLRVARRIRPGRGTGVYLRDWLAGSLEDGSFEDLPVDDRRVAYERMGRAIDASFRDRLARVVASGEGASCAAAYLILRRLEGEPLDAAPDAGLAPEAKRWWVRRVSGER